MSTEDVAALIEKVDEQSRIMRQMQSDYCAQRKFFKWFIGVVVLIGIGLYTIPKVEMVSIAGSLEAHDKLPYHDGMKLYVSQVKEEILEVQHDQYIDLTTSIIKLQGSIDVLNEKLK